MSIVLAGKRVLVIGARRTGVAVARFLAKHGARVFLLDQSRNGFDEERKALAGLPVEWLLGDENPALLEGIELVVPSPGVPPSSPLLRTARSRGIPVLSEVELASRFLGLPVYGITGTNGKSTTTELVGAMLRAADRRPFVGGNLGTPLIEAVSERYDAAVVELSSFQLEWTEQFRPQIGVFLNLSPDHLERYGSLDEYGEAKARLFAQQGPEDWAVISREDAWVWNLRERLPGRVISFGFHRVELGAFAEEGGFRIRLGGRSDAPEGDCRFSLTRTRLRGVHNLENLMAAATVALLAEVPPEAIQQAIDRFAGLPHRLELVREKDGIVFVDDSKGTNVGAVVRSLESLPGPVVLLAGGVDKGASYEPLRSLVRSRVKRLVVFGEARDRMAHELGDASETVAVDSFADAVGCAVEAARPGDTVLLSPACASFDMFRDYAERGERYRALVEAL